MAEESSVPLLAQENILEDDPQEAMIQRLKALQQAQQLHVGDLMKNAPELVVKFIAEHCVTYVQEFNVQEKRLPKKLLKKDEFLTSGLEARNPDGLEDTWRGMLHTAKESENNQLLCFLGGLGDSINKFCRQFSFCANKVRREEHKEDPEFFDSNQRIVEAWVVDIKKACDPKSNGLLEPILIRQQEINGSLKVFGYPAVTAVIDHKYKNYYGLLLAQLCVFCVWLFSFTLFVIWFKDDHSDMDFGDMLLSPTGGGRLKILNGIIILVAMAPFVFIEMNTWLSYGVHWLSFWNMIDIATYTLQVIIIVMQWANATKGSFITVAIATQSLLLWGKFLSYIRMFNVNTALDAVIFVVKSNSTLFFSIFVVMAAFAQAFYITYRTNDPDNPPVEQFRTPGHAVASMFFFMLGGFEFELFWEADLPWVSLVLFFLFQLVITIILLNIIIAAMETTWDSYNAEEKERFYRVRASIIDELEVSLPSWLLRVACNPEWFPNYVHILRLKKADPKLDISQVESFSGPEIPSSVYDLQRYIQKVEWRILDRISFLELELLGTRRQARTDSYINQYNTLYEPPVQQVNRAYNKTFK